MYSVVCLPKYFFLKLSILVVIYFIVVICNPTQIPEKISFEQIKFAKMSVEFSFDNIMHRQIDGVTMGVSIWTFFGKYFCGVSRLGINVQSK